MGKMTAVVIRWGPVLHAGPLRSTATGRLKVRKMVNVMEAHKDILQSRWHELKGFLQKRWGKLTEDDIAKQSGKQEELVLALRRRYGYAQAQAVMEINRWISDHDREKGQRSK